MRQIESHAPAQVAETLAEMEFRELATFDDGQVGVFWSGPGGTSPWEMHPDCDEMLQVLSGGISVEILPEGAGAGVLTRVSAGELLVIPQGCWHRQTMLERTQELYLTPGRSLHSMADDPRAEIS